MRTDTVVVLVKKYYIILPPDSGEPVFAILKVPVGEAKQFE
jgi:hypothetical protein